MDVQVVSYVFIYLSVEVFSKLFNFVFITSYLQPSTAIANQQLAIKFLRKLDLYV